MTALTELSESCRAIPRLVESVKDLVMFNVKHFINFMVCIIVPPNFWQNQFVGALL